MRSHGELSEEEVAKVSEIHRLIDEVGKIEDESFLDRAALSDDPRWEHIRMVAAEVLHDLPNDLRESEWTKRNWTSGPGKAISAG
uniref:hypothetical protein n=1 Tax=uncultured Altererythrobacter sp. TaxID=500840 RepID=UPI0026164719|nr:hypothetical protein [uncultured Altererythrobacter sp.]